MNHIKINLDNYLDNPKDLYEEVKKHKQEVLPDDFKLIFNYNKDFYNSDTSIGNNLKTLQKYISELDIPHFFVWVVTGNQSIESDLKTLQSTYNPHETIPINSILKNNNFHKDYYSGETLCYYPWVHYFVNPQGKVGPCCTFDENYSYGNIKNQSIKDIGHNGEKVRKLRTQLLQGQRPDVCNTCWEDESMGLKSKRIVDNDAFIRKLSKDFLDKKIQETTADGTVNFELKMLDARFKNTCNMMCRMCSGKFSSKIANEEKKHYNDYTYINASLSEAHIQSVMDDVIDQIQNIDQVYFAGGEPLIIDEHYKILDLLLKNNRTEIELRYNTNFSILEHKKYNVIDYWKKFKNVKIGASIDLFGDKSNYVRQGAEYNIFEKNYQTLIAQCPHVKFNISSIVHALNIISLQELQDRWIFDIGISPLDMRFRILVWPDFLRASVLPNDIKSTYIDTIYKHIEKLKTINDTDHLIEKWQSVIKFMLENDHSHLYPRFLKLMQEKDQFRNQSLFSLYPELKID